MITIKQIQEKIIEAIKASGLTQSKLAKKLGISQPAVALYISGKALPALDTLANLCVILDLDANDILCVNQTANSNKNNINISGNYINNSGNINFH